MKKNTLKKRLVSLLALTFVIVALIAIGTILGYSRFKKAANDTSIKTRLSANVSPQVNSLLISYLVIEQQSGAKILLEQFKKQEELSHSLLIENGNMPKEFSSCHLSEKTNFCTSEDGRYLGIITPIKNQDKLYAYFLKAKNIGRDELDSTLLSLVIGCVGVLFFAFMSLFLGIAKITSRDIPKAFGELKNWLERVLGEKPDSIRPHFSFAEFEELTGNIDEILVRSEKTRQENVNLIKESAIAKIAQQVAHDIRSPLAALDMATSQLKDSPEELRVLIRSAVRRIHDIANDLSTSKRTPTETKESVIVEKMSVQLLSSLVESLVSEKRLQLRSRTGLEIDAELGTAAYGLFANIETVELKRVLSNLINNASEGIADSGKIIVRLFSENERITLQVDDTGNGIPPEILPRLMTRGETHGKTGGSGLGLYHAKTSIEKWNGTMTLASTVGIGTTVTISLPQATAPEWFVPEIKINPDATVVVIDDDDSIHKIWKRRVDSIKNSTKNIAHFSSPEEFITWYQSNTEHHSKMVVLCDYEFLGADKTGIDIIRECGIQDKSILVTSRFEEDAVRKTCAEIGVRLLPKNLAGFVPIVVEPTPSKDTNPNTRETVDAILIDDDDLVHVNWKMAAKRQNKIVRVYAGPEEFWKESADFSKDTPIYVDSNLADGVKGEDVAWMMGKKGFSNLHLATGYEASQFEEMPWLKGIVGKSPPWI
jgi:signal transduction histidine kinase